MTNVKATVNGDKLTLVIDLSQDHGPSASGKTTCIASTRGNVSIEGADPDIKIGLNIYRRK